MFSDGRWLAQMTLNLLHAHASANWSHEPITPRPREVDQPNHRSHEREKESRYPVGVLLTIAHRV